MALPASVLVIFILYGASPVTGYYIACGNTVPLTADMGTLYSPNYGTNVNGTAQNYPKACHSQISIVAGGTIQVIFETFSLASGDSVRVVDQDPAALYSTYFYGTTLPIVPRLSSSIVVTFDSSSSSATSAGFKMSWTVNYVVAPTAPASILAGDTYNIDLTGATATTFLYIKSPNYPNLYPNNAKINWIVRSDVNQTIALDFAAFVTEHNKDVLQVYDGADVTTQTLVVSYSGDLSSNLPPRLQSISNRLQVKFTSDATMQAKGFYLRCSLFSLNLPLFALTTVPGLAAVNNNPGGVAASSSTDQGTSTTTTVALAIFIPLIALIAIAGAATYILWYKPRKIRRLREQSGRQYKQEGRPGTARPGTARPGTARPGTARPETARPGTARPGTALPSAARPGTARPGTAVSARPQTARPPSARPTVELFQVGRPAASAESEPVAAQRPKTATAQRAAAGTPSGQSFITVVRTEFSNNPTLLAPPGVVSVPSSEVSPRSRTTSKQRKVFESITPSDNLDSTEAPTVRKQDELPLANAQNGPKWNQNQHDDAEDKPVNNATHHRITTFGMPTQDLYEEITVTPPTARHNLNAPADAQGSFKVSSSLDVTERSTSDVGDIPAISSKRLSAIGGDEEHNSISKEEMRRAKKKKSQKAELPPLAGGMKSLPPVKAPIDHRLPPINQSRLQPLDESSYQDDEANENENVQTSMSPKASAKQESYGVSMTTYGTSSVPQIGNLAMGNPAYSNEDDDEW